MVLWWSMIKRSKKWLSAIQVSNRTPEFREKISLALKGKPKSEEHRKSISESLRKQWAEGKREGPNKGRKWSDEYKEKQRLAHLGSKGFSWKGGRPKCIDCGKQLAAYGAKRCPHCDGQRRTGVNNHNWKGGITPLRGKIRGSGEYKLWRKAVFERDNYICVFCGLRSGNGRAVILNADHIKPFCDYPELRFAIDNGRTLCKECHDKITFKKYWV